MTIAGPPLGRLTRSRLTKSSERELRFETWQAARSPVLIAPFAVVLAALPWLNTEPIDGLQALVSGLLATAGLGLVAWGAPRRRVTRIDVAGPALITRRQRLTVAPTATWTLTTTPPASTSEEGHYVALFGPVDGRAWPLLIDRDPGSLLRSLQAAQARFPAPVSGCDWGLPAQAQPWHYGPRPAAALPVTGTEEAPPGETVLQTPRASTGLQRLLAILGGLTLLDLTVLVASESARLSFVHPISILLPVLMGVYVLVLSIGLATYHRRLAVGQSVAVETRSLGVRRSIAHIDSRAVRGVYVVSPRASHRSHLLVDSDEGPLSIPVPTVDAARYRQLAQTAIRRRAETFRHRAPSELASASAASHK